MKLSDNALAGLRLELAKWDHLAALSADLLAQIAAAEPAARRVRGQIAEVDAKIAATADPRIAVDADRLAGLIGGAHVPQPKAKDIEQRALQARILGAQRAQLVDDLAAVERHIAGLRERQTEAAAGANKAEWWFMVALSDAMLAEADAAMATLVREVMRPLATIRAVMQKLRPGETSAVPVMLMRYVAEAVQLTHFSRDGAMEMWPPRGSGERLWNGQPVLAPEMIGALIEQVRGTPAEPAGGAAATPA